MKTSQLQKTVQAFNLQYNNDIEVDARVLDLSSEIGELCKLSFKVRVGQPVSFKDWEEELGDALYSMLSLMNKLNVNAESALETVLKKYEARLKKNGVMQSNP
ncbi:MAG: MazG nucleotide pyrophosphohydrolase domain-containing protein [Bdellovibrio sp.]